MFRKRACAFDLGGVVVDVDKRHLYDLHTDRAVVDAAFFGPEHDAMSVGALSGDAYLAHAAAVLAVDVDVVRVAWRGVVRFSAGGLALLAEVATSTRLLLWSNTDPHHADALFGVAARVADIADVANVAKDAAHFAAVDAAVNDRDRAFSFAIGAMKPDPAFFARALVNSGLDAADVVFVDDRADNVAAARAAGIDAHIAAGVAAARAVFVAHAAGRARL